MRRASTLILVAGIVAMLAVLATTFLVRMRQDAEESGLVGQMAQCRLMLHAGMQFVQESSRVGYADADPAVEAWGWVDVRNGAVGPLDNQGDRLWQPGQWPAPGTALRAPMFMHRRPPCAVVPHMHPNRIPDIDDPAVDPDYHRTFGIPVLARPDPAPALDPAAGPHDPTSSDQLRDWLRGDATPRSESLGLAWFRVYREDGSEPDRPAAAGGRARDGSLAASFVITVGAGGTQGFRDWGEAVRAGQTAAFGDDQGTFEVLLAAELRQWFRVVWSGAVGGGENRAFTIGVGNPKNYSPIRIRNGYHARVPVNSSRFMSPVGTNSSMSSAEPRNYVGTITYIQRLTQPPQGNKW